MHHEKKIHLNNHKSRDNQNRWLPNAKDIIIAKRQAVVYRRPSVGESIAVERLTLFTAALHYWLLGCA